MELKLGKLPFEEDDRDILLSTLIDKTVLPKPPASTDDYKTFDDWGMFLNNQIGCCAIAGPYHLLMLWLKQGGKDVTFIDANVLKVYEDISGYDPNDPSTDVGCQLRDVLKYWKNVGMPDSEGNLHKIGAFARLNLKDHEEIKIAQYLFSGLDIGFMVPAFIMQLFQQGIYYWDVQTINAQILGGHCVVPTGYGKYNKKVKAEVVAVTKEGVWVITWGRAVFMTWDFWNKFVDEAWVVFDPEMLDNDKSPDGFDSNKLLAYLKKLSEG